MEADATAAFVDNIVGFRVTDKTGNAMLLPFAVDREAWRDLLNGNGADEWSYDSDSGGVIAEPDRIHEMVMFPDRILPSGVTPGNFGTVDIGAAANSSADLRRQIVSGMSAEDLEYHGGELKLDALTGEIILDGDTGIDVDLQLALAEIIGQERTLPLYREVNGNGDNAAYVIVGFVGIRVLDFNMRGQSKYVIIQPAFVMDDTAVVGQWGESYFVGQPIHLVR
jgi:hypothetical protein